jgi:hypothetical protein
VARPSRPAGEAELRAYLLADRREFRKLMCVTLCENREWSALAWQECSKSVNALASGAAYRFSGYALPDDHPLRAVVGPYADLVLGCDDVLRVVS